MSKVKICGLKREQDIGFVNHYLPEYAGFVFAKSKRQVTLCQAGALISLLDPRIKSVGIFVNEEIDQVVEMVCGLGLDAVQIHGDESSEYAQDLKERIRRSEMNHRKKINGQKDGKTEIWKAVRVKDEKSIEAMQNYDVDAFLLDTYIEGSYGGAGQTFDWNLARRAKAYGKIILAGGLNHQNVQRAIDVAQPYSVDISSGVETDGVKDEGKIRDFINLVRCYG